MESCSPEFLRGRHHVAGQHLAATLDAAFSTKANDQIKIRAAI